MMEVPALGAQGRRRKRRTKTHCFGKSRSTPLPNVPLRFEVKVTVGPGRPCSARVVTVDQRAKSVDAVRLGTRRELGRSPLGRLVNLVALETNT